MAIRLDDFQKTLNLIGLKMSFIINIIMSFASDFEILMISNHDL